MLRFDGTSWIAEHAAPLALQAIWGSGSSDIYVVGWRGVNAAGGPALLHFDGSAWSESALPFAAPGLGDIWGSSASDVFVVGQQQTILRYSP